MLGVIDIAAANPVSASMMIYVSLTGTSFAWADILAIAQKDITTQLVIFLKYGVAPWLGPTLSMSIL